MTANGLSAYPLAADEPMDLRKHGAASLAESSNSINIPPAADENKPLAEDSGKENLFRKPPSVSADDGEPAIDLKANEHGFGDSRPSSVASWVQSWFSPRD